MSVATGECPDTTVSHGFKMPVIACCFWAQITPTSLLFDDLLKDFRLDLSKASYYLLCFSQEKLQPDRKKTPASQEENPANQEETPASQKKTAPARKSLQPAKKKRRPANMTILAFLKRSKKSQDLHAHLMIFSSVASMLLCTRSHFLFVSRISPSLQLSTSCYRVFPALLSSS